MLTGHTLRACLVSLLLACAGCETVPQLRAPNSFRDAARPTLVVITDVRPEEARSSRVERSGARPIVLLGDDRFEVTPIELLEGKLVVARRTATALRVHRFDVRYLQGGSLDSLNSSLSLSASMVSPILGAIVYGGMSAKARSDDPSRVEVTFEGTWRGKPLLITHQQNLNEGTENDALRAAVVASIEKIVSALPD